MVTEHAIHHAAGSGESGENPFLLLSLTLILASLILSTSIYFSAQALGRTIEAKEFSVSSPVTANTAAAQANTAAGTGANAAAKPTTAPTAAPSAPTAAGGCGVAAAPSAGTAGAAAPVKTATADVTGRTVSGPATAKVTIVEFTEFQCPYCIRVQPTLAQLEKDYAGKVNFVHMNFIVHPTAVTASTAVECAGDQNKYWAMHDQIFSTKKTDEAGLRTLAQNLSLDLTKYDACMQAGKQATLDAQKAIGSGVGVSGTPSFVIGIRSGNKVNGQFIVGAQDISVFKAAIDAQLKN